MILFNTLDDPSSPYCKGDDHIHMKYTILSSYKEKII